MTRTTNLKKDELFVNTNWKHFTNFSHRQYIISLAFICAYYMIFFYPKTNFNGFLYNIFFIFLFICIFVLLLLFIYFDNNNIMSYSCFHVSESVLNTFIIFINHHLLFSFFDHLLFHFLFHFFLIGLEFKTLSSNPYPSAVWIRCLREVFIVLFFLFCKEWPLFLFVFKRLPLLWTPDLVFVGFDIISLWWQGRLGGGGGGLIFYVLTL